ncbi:MAG: PQQ-binding-like beta-propeller repeat protein [Planctomycetota bacterium]|nr:MAG: PQQ-binding-like beta-propeller repeat protein [Planctomycetota bacterium]
MLKELRIEKVLAAGFFVMCAALSGAAFGEVYRPLVSPELLEHAKLELVWETKLPMKGAESLEQLHILGNRIYGLSSRNYMVSLNREKGNVIFSRTVAPVGLPVVGLGLYEGELFSIIGNELVQMNPEFGTERSSKRLAFGIACPAVRNSEYFYITGTDRRIRGLRSDDKVKVFEGGARNDSRVTSVVADEDFIVFGTDAGNVVSVEAGRPVYLWQFDAEDGIAGSIARDGGSLFVASKDTNVYRLGVYTGKLEWKYQAGAVLDKGPVVTGGVVYQCVGEKGMAAIAKASGKFMWQLEGGASLLTESGGKAYVITDIGELVVMDNRKAKRLYSVNFSGVSRYVTNLSDSKIYIADEGGRLACIRPIGQEQ